MFCVFPVRPRRLPEPTVAESTNQVDVDVVVHVAVGTCLDFYQIHEIPNRP